MGFSGLDGFDDFSEELEKYISAADDNKVAEIVKAAADEYVNDVRALPKPRRAIGGGYTHMLDSVAAQRDGTSYLVGWGKYYGPFVEKGTRKMSAQPHLRPTWDANADKYTRIMQKKFLEVR